MDDTSEAGCSNSNQQEQVEKPTETIKKRKVCRFYLRTKGCKFGEQCRFSHILPLNGNISEKSVNGSSGETPVPSTDLDENQKSQAETTQSQNVETQENTDSEISSGFPSLEEKTSELSLEDSRASQEISRKDDTKSQSSQAGNKRRRRCRFFFSRSGCKRGDRCQFSHVKHENQPANEKLDTDQENQDSSKSKQSQDTNNKPVKNQDTPKPRPPMRKPEPTTQRLSTLDEKELVKLRQRELDQSRRRFGQEYLRVLQDDKEAAVYDIDFYPTDPDWPFDVNYVRLLVTFPDDYPKQLFEVALSEEQNLPPELIMYVNEGIEKWENKQQEIRNSKDTVNLPFRAFLRWLDRNLEELFIEAGKKMRKEEEGEPADVEIIQEKKTVSEGPQSTGRPGAQRQHREGNSTRRERSHERRELLLGDFMAFTTKSQFKQKGGKKSKPNLEDLMTTDQKSKVQYVIGEDGASMEAKYCLPTSYRPAMRHTEQDSENDDHMAQSSSDNTTDDDGDNSDDGDSNDEKSKTQEADASASDNKADPKHRGTEIRLKGVEMTENTSTITASAVTLTMECGKCKVKTDIKADKTKPILSRCERCTNIQTLVFRPAIIHQYSSTLGYLDVDGWKPFDLTLVDTKLLVGCLNCSKESPIKDLNYGVNQGWCSKCHQKLYFKVESARFYQLQPAMELLSETAKQALMAEKPKRQPKTPGLKEGYPLPDNGTCKHYKKSFRWLRFPCCGKCYPCDVCHEESESHEMAFASRMVCGYCSKEQMFSQNPCVACKSSMTKAKTSHWEGGRGCRTKPSWTEETIENTRTRTKQSLGKQKPRASQKTKSK